MVRRISERAACARGSAASVVACGYKLRGWIVVFSVRKRRKMEQPSTWLKACRTSTRFRPEEGKGTFPGQDGPLTPPCLWGHRKKEEARGEEKGKVVPLLIKELVRLSGKGSNSGRRGGEETRGGRPVAVKC